MEMQIYLSEVARFLRRSDMSQREVSSSIRRLCFKQFGNVLWATLILEEQVFYISNEIIETIVEIIWHTNYSYSLDKMSRELLIDHVTWQSKRVPENIFPIKAEKISLDPV